ncbi:hypothetical protein [Paraburkholderia tropica]|uniref:hypothetical protein n=1 Tax=Paraburkholderia tropica TaxID=92647 RepID=UPI002AB70AED|nr:hypothetical protein [Paraburkholderia tropica]
MDWQQELTVVDGQMYADSRWLGRFSSHQAAIEGLQVKRNQLSEHKCRAMCESDFDLLACIDFDEE